METLVRTATYETQTTPVRPATQRYPLEQASWRFILHRCSEELIAPPGQAQQWGCKQKRHLSTGMCNWRLTSSMIRLDILKMHIFSNINPAVNTSDLVLSTNKTFFKSTQLNLTLEKQPEWSWLLKNLFNNLSDRHFLRLLVLNMPGYDDILSEPNKRSSETEQSLSDVQ